MFQLPPRVPISINLTQNAITVQSAPVAASWCRAVSAVTLLLSPFALFNPVCISTRSFFLLHSRQTMSFLLLRVASRNSWKGPRRRETRKKERERERKRQFLGKSHVRMVLPSRRYIHFLGCEIMRGVRRQRKRDRFVGRIEGKRKR